MPRIAAALFATVALYTAYALVVVPLVEPEDIDLTGTVAPSDEQVEAARLGPANQLARLRTWFQEGDWELNTSKIIETSQGKLLLSEYETRRDGLVKITPCTIILIPDETHGTEAQRNHEAIVLRAPDGALIRFDGELDLARGQVGKPIAGTLLGPVTITSRRKLPGPEDDLEIVTRDVELGSDRITTEHQVHFRVGENRGTGRGLTIELLRKPGAGKSVLESDGIRNLTLEHEVRAEVELGDAELVPNQFAKQKSPDVKPAPASGPPPPPTPVIVTCVGPFQFDAETYTATFHRDVDVVRLYPDGPSDQLSCQRLSIYFEPSTDPASADRGQFAGKLTARRLEAIGKPVTLEAPQMGVTARGELLRYDLQTGQATLTSQHEATIRRGTDLVSAGELHYQPDPAGGPPRILAVGAGWIEAAPPDNPQVRFQASWTDKLEVYPHRGLEVVAIHGQADVRSDGFGRLRADEIFLFLEPISPATTDESASTKYEPKRMSAQGNVRIDSDQVTAEVDTLQAWFERQAPAPAVATTIAAPPQVERRPPPGTVTAAVETAPRLERLPAPTRLASASTAVRPATGQPAIAPPSSPPKSRFHVTARELLVELRLGGEATELSQLMARDRVELDEIPNAATTEIPLAIRGDYVHVDQREIQRSVAIVQGRPGRVAGRGMTIDGGRITLNRGENTLLVDTPGHLSLPPQSQDAGVSETAHNVDIYWQGQMHFDGRHIRFQDQVVAQQPGQQLSTEQMDVFLTRRVDFTQPDAETRPEIDHIVCTRDVVLDRSARDKNGRPSVEHVEALRLDLEHGSGDIDAQGPGRLRSFRYSSDQGFALTPAASAPNRATPAADRPVTPKLLDVRFDQQAIGNFRERQLSLVGRVRALYGPVDHPDQQLDPDRLGPSDVYLTCDQIDVVQLQQADGQATVELMATGNTEVEGEQFTARGHRIRYAQGKDLLILEGGEHTLAELYRQTSVDSPPQATRGRRIKYWRGSNQVQIEGVRSLDAIGMVPHDRTR